MKVYGIILAAGKGTRMHTDIPKCAYPLLDKPMVEYLIESCEESKIDEIISIVGYKKEVLMDVLGSRTTYAIQDEQLGTGHAVKCALPYIKEDGVSIVIPGDTPLIDKDIINSILDSHLKNNNGITVGTIILEEPGMYGRVVRDKSNNFLKIVEAKDATEDELKIKEINAALYCVDNNLMKEALNKIKLHSVSGEYYFTDIVELIGEKHKIGTFTIKDAYKLKGINDLDTLHEIEDIVRSKK